MKNLFILCLGLTLSNYSSAQITVSDDLSWFTNVNTLITSPYFAFCDNDSINYTIQTFAGSDISAYNGTTYTNPSWTAGAVGGIYIPGNYLTNTSTSINVVLTFSQAISYLSLYLADLDAPSGTSNQETITSIVPPFQNTSSAATFFPTAQTSGGYSSVVAQNPIAPFNKVDNSSGWIVWSNLAPTTTFSFTYNRITGTAIGIEAIEIFCEQSTAGLIDAEFASSNELDILVSPNPSQGNYSVAITGANFSGAKAAVYTLDGRIVQEFGITTTNFQLNLENQEKGTYFLKVISADGITTVKTLVKE